MLTPEKRMLPSTFATFSILFFAACSSAPPPPASGGDSGSVSAPVSAPTPGAQKNVIVIYSREGKGKGRVGRIRFDEDGAPILTTSVDGAEADLLKDSFESIRTTRFLIDETDYRGGRMQVVNSRVVTPKDRVDYQDMWIVALKRRGFMVGVDNE